MAHMSEALKRFLSVGLAALLACPASALSPVPTASPATSALVRIGAAGGVKGAVKAFAPGDNPVGRILASGQPLYLNEKIQTGPDGSMQVMLMDETVFTIGANSSMTLDEFVYNPADHSGRVTATVTNGVFRFVTGQIGHRKPSDMKVKFPVGTMGIRGTMVAGQVTPQGMTAVLLGPGPAHNAPGERIGAFSLENAGTKVDVVKPGYATHIDGPHLAPTAPVLMAQTQLASILGQIAHAPKAAVAKPAAAAPATTAAAPATTASAPDQNSATPATAAPAPDQAAAAPATTAPTPDQTAAAPATAAPAPDQTTAAPATTASAPDQTAAAPAPAQTQDPNNPTNDSSSGQSATAASGQTTASAQGDLSTTQDIASLGLDLSGYDLNAVKDIDAITLTNLIATFQDTWDNIQKSITVGTGQFAGTGSFNLTACGGGACNFDGSGTLDFLLDIDFGNKTIGSAASHVMVSATDSALPGGSVNDTVSFAQQSYAALTGAAVLSGTSAAGNTTATVNILNITGPASHATAQANYQDASGTTGSGAILAPRH